MKFADSAGSFLEISVEKHGTATGRAFRIVLAIALYNLANTSVSDVVVRRKSDGREVLRRGILHGAEFIVDEMRYSLPRLDVDGFVAKWSASEFLARES